jgi:hypothetical protein
MRLSLLYPMTSLFLHFSFMYLNVASVKSFTDKRNITQYEFSLGTFFEMFALC